MAGQGLDDHDMFDLINGLPVHPLVVHAVVALLPLACLGTLAIAVRPVWRRQHGVLVVARSRGLGPDPRRHLQR